MPIPFNGLSLKTQKRVVTKESGVKQNKRISLKRKNLAVNIDWRYFWDNKPILCSNGLWYRKESIPTLIIKIL